MPFDPTILASIGGSTRYSQYLQLLNNGIENNARALERVLRAGDTMTGQLDMDIESDVPVVMRQQNGLDSSIFVNGIDKPFTEVILQMGRGVSLGGTMPNGTYIRNLKGSTNVQFIAADDGKAYKGDGTSAFEFWDTNNLANPLTTATGVEFADQSGAGGTPINATWTTTGTGIQTDTKIGTSFSLGIGKYIFFAEYRTHTRSVGNQVTSSIFESTIEDNATGTFTHVNLQRTTIDVLAEDGAGFRYHSDAFFVDITAATTGIFWEASLVSNAGVGDNTASISLNDRTDGYVRIG